MDPSHVIICSGVYDIKICDICKFKTKVVGILYSRIYM